MSFDPVTAIGDAISGVFGIIKEPIKQWGERKAIKLQAETDIKRLHADALVKTAEAKVEAAKQGKIIESDWDSRAQEQMKFSWKDELLMIIIFFPVVLLFVSAFFTNDAFQKRVIASVNALEKFPLWYVVLICGIVAAVFGLRWLIAPLVTKMRSKP